MERNWYIEEQLLKAVLHLATGLGDIKERLGAVFQSRLIVLNPPRHTFPGELQDRFSEIMERLRQFETLSPEDCSEVASMIFNLWMDYERQIPSPSP